MKLNTRLTLPTIILGLAIVAIPFAANWHLPLLNGTVVSWIENGQALWLLFGAIFTLSYIRPLSRPKARSNFGFGRQRGGWYYWAEAQVGAAIIFLSILNSCSGLSQWY